MRKVDQNWESSSEKLGKLSLKVRKVEPQKAGYWRQKNTFPNYDLRMIVNDDFYAQRVEVYFHKKSVTIHFITTDIELII